jgi:hypothetical protein
VDGFVAPLRPVIGSVEDRFGNGLAVTRSFVLVAGLLVGGSDWSGLGLVGVWDR